MRQEQENKKKKAHKHHPHHGHHHGESGQQFDEKHLLKKRIIKLLKRKEQVNFSQLVFKLDIQPSKLFHVLKKLEQKGLIYHEKEGSHRDKPGKENIKAGKHHGHEKQHFHHQGHKDEKGKGRCGHHSSRPKCGAQQEKCHNHCHQKNKSGKAPWQRAGNVKIGLAAV